MRALVRNSGTSRVVAPPEMMGTGVRRGRKPKARVPDAAHWGGLGRSSDEGAVTALERRPQPSRWTVWPIWTQRGALCGTAGGGSRMSREAHVRFDGSGEGQFLPATLLYRSELNSVALRIDQHLVRWAMRKFKRLKGNPKGAWAWWHAARQRSPRLFAHWNLSPTSSRPARAG